MVKVSFRDFKNKLKILNSSSRLPVILQLQPGAVYLTQLFTENTALTTYYLNNSYLTLKLPATSNANDLKLVLSPTVFKLLDVDSDNELLITYDNSANFVKFTIDNVNIFVSVVHTITPYPANTSHYEFKLIFTNEVLYDIINDLLQNLPSDTDTAVFELITNDKFINLTTSINSYSKTYRLFNDENISVNKKFTISIDYLYILRRLLRGDFEIIVLTFSNSLTFYSNRFIMNLVF